MKKNFGILVSSVALLVAIFLAGCTTGGPQVVPRPIPLSNEVDASVQRLLKADAQLNAFDIQVNTFRGHVILDGVVDTEEQRQQASSLAWAVPGVTGVENNIRLRSEVEQ